MSAILAEREPFVEDAALEDGFHSFDHESGCNVSVDLLGCNLRFSEQVTDLFRGE